jgi:oligopeptide transport system substrate-binding protein
MRVGAALMIAVGLLLLGCSSVDPEAPVTMSVIGDAAAPIQKNQSATEQASVISATAQGLVAFDGEGQIEPALAERWIVTDDGLSIIFRIRRTKWADGRPVTSAAVARGLQQLIKRDSRNRLQPMLGAIDQVIAMTGQVLEIRLKSPQRDFFQLLAQPDMAIFSGSRVNGSGPYRVHSVRDGVTRLRLTPADGEASGAEASQRNDVRIRREPAAFAITRFAGREIGLVTGGRFSTLPLVRPAGIANNQFSMDPTYGLFGLVVVNGSEALAKINVRRALAMAIDREKLVARFGVNAWAVQYALLPNQFDSANPPAALEWVGLDEEARIARARGYISDVGKVSVIRVALPSGPGARLLFAGIAADWQRIGVSAVRVAMNEPADLRLIDEVAPHRAALWYLSRFACARGFACSVPADTAMRAALSASQPAQRAAAIAEADAAIASEQIFIPIAAPLRWSLVSPEMIGWRPNSFAAHPLHHLRQPLR